MGASEVLKMFLGGLITIGLATVVLQNGSNTVKVAGAGTNFVTSGLKTAMGR